MYRTKDQVASEFIAEGQRRGITSRGIAICIATGLVESNLTVYANSKVSESLQLPHDAVGSDGFSVGPLQQQVVMGDNGWWWGDAATCMDPTKSAGLFYDRLAHLDYNGPNSPGSYAQAIQRSAYPTRYDERMGEAQGYYDRLSGASTAPAITPPNFTETNLIGVNGVSNNCQDRRGTTIDCFLTHTVEGNLGGLGLANFMADAGVSYHYIVDLDEDGNTVWDCVDTDLASWSVLDANNRSINYVIGRSTVAWSRDQWIAKARNAIRIVAYLKVQDAIKYGQAQKARFAAPPYSIDPPVYSDHKYVTEYLGIGTHTDMGPNYPYDLEAADIEYFLHGEDDDVPLVNQPSGSIYRESNDNLPWAGTPMDFIMDAQIHEGRVESLAIQGFPEALDLVKAVAEGRSPVNDNLTDGQRQHAQSILDYIAKQAG